MNVMMRGDFTGLHRLHGNCTVFLYSLRCLTDDKADLQASLFWCKNTRIQKISEAVRKCRLAAREVGLHYDNISHSHVSLPRSGSCQRKESWSNSLLFIIFLPVPSIFPSRTRRETFSKRGVLHNILNEEGKYRGKNLFQL